MNSWFRLTVKRTSLAVLLVMLLVFILVWQPSRGSQSLVHQQLGVTDAGINKLKEAQTSLSSLPSLNKIKIQKFGVIRLYADFATKVSEEFKTIEIASPNVTKPILGIKLAGNTELIDDINEVIGDIKSHATYLNFARDIEVAKQLMTYHAEVSNALVNLLEYNPSVDTKNFSFGSVDTQKRLKLTKGGLDKAIQRLQDAKTLYSDESLNAVIDSINKLQITRNQLAKNGNTDAWGKIFSQVQKQITENRIRFWDLSVKSTTDKLRDDLQDMVEANNLWRRVARKYKIDQ